MRSLLGLMNQFLLITKILLLGILSLNVFSFGCKKNYPSEVNWGNDMIWEFLKKHRKTNG